MGLPWVTYFERVGVQGLDTSEDLVSNFTTVLQWRWPPKCPFYPPMEQIGGVKWRIRVRGTQLSLDFGSLGQFKGFSPDELTGLEQQGNYNIAANISGRADGCCGSMR